MSCLGLGLVAQTPVAQTRAPQALAPAPARVCEAPPCPTTLDDHFRMFTSSVFSWDTPVTPLIVMVPIQHFTSHDGYRDGEKGYVNQYKVAMYDTIDFTFQRHFLYPALFHQDESYVPLGAGNPFGARAHHALGHLLMTRSADHSHTEFNASGIPAAATTALVSDLYQPATLRTTSQFATNFGLNIVLRVFADLMMEFIPKL